MVGITTQYRREYNSWHGAKYRCTSEKHPAWENYGGRGISMCPEWMDSFEQFLADMGDRPEGKELDRINNDGNYEPGNCRWVTASENARNKSRAIQYIKPKKFGHDGIKATLDIWSAMLGVPLEELKRREALGLPTDCLLGFRVKPGSIIIENVLYQLSDLSVQYSISAATIKNRVTEGATFRQAVGLDRWQRSRVNKNEDIQFLTVKGVSKHVGLWSNLGHISTQEIRTRIHAGATAAQAVGLEPYTEEQEERFIAQLKQLPHVTIM